jgi:hypothetical protein
MREEAATPMFIIKGWMMEAEYMTPQQLRELADKKEKESNIVATGRLKHDIFSWHAPYKGSNTYTVAEQWYLEHEVKNIIKDFSDGFHTVLPAGTPFHCQIVDGEPNWFDDKGVVEFMDDFWARENLIVD